jgi:hypothetical protein
MLLLSDIKLQDQAVAGKPFGQPVGYWRRRCLSGVHSKMNTLDMDSWLWSGKASKGQNRFSAGYLQRCRQFLCRCQPDFVGEGYSKPGLACGRTIDQTRRNRHTRP